MKIKQLAQAASSRTNLPSDDWLLPHTFVGVELETENFNERHINKEDRLRLYDYWRKDHDGSLRNNGIELVSYPVMGKDLIQAVQYLGKYMPKNIQWSIRTSAHVHVDVRDCDLSMILSSIYFYIVMEPFLFTYAPDRIGSQYCIPWFCSMGDGVQQVLRILQSGENLDDLPAKLDFMHRYSALNIKALRKYATLEFRHLQGTTNTKLLKSWINLLMGIIKAGHMYKPAEILNRVGTVSDRAQLVEQVYGKFAHLVTDNPDYERCLEHGYQTLVMVMEGVDSYFYQDTREPATESSYGKYRKIRKKKRTNEAASKVEAKRKPKPMFDLDADFNL